MIRELLGEVAFDPLPQLATLLVAYLLALPIGWNREKAERTAGVRTFPLVAIAACGFVQAAEGIAADSPEALARIIEGAIVGMGFIGGGAILRHHESVKGTATAASLWVTGAVGVAVGVGSLDVAVILAALAFATLWLLAPLKAAARGAEEE